MSEIRFSAQMPVFNNTDYQKEHKLLSSSFPKIVVWGFVLFRIFR